MDLVNRAKYFLKPAGLMMAGALLYHQAVAQPEPIEYRKYLKNQLADIIFKLEVDYPTLIERTEDKVNTFLLYSGENAMRADRLEFEGKDRLASEFEKRSDEFLDSASYYRDLHKRLKEAYKKEKPELKKRAEEILDLLIPSKGKESRESSREEKKTSPAKKEESAWNSYG